MSEQREAPILVRNKDVEHIVNAAANIGHYAAEVQIDKRFSLLVTADVHRCRKQVLSAVEYLNGMKALDAGICLGDMQGSNFIENDGTWYTTAVNEAKKPFYTVIGNHDGGNSAKAKISGTKQQVFDKFIAPTMEQIGIEGLDKTYYAVNFDEYKVTLIVLDNYDVPDERDAQGDFVVHRGVDYISQAQADWFVQTLANVPQDYHVLIARHSFPGKAITHNGPWTILNKNLTNGEPGCCCEIIPDIVNAWMNGTTFEQEYKVGAALTSTLSNPAVLPPVTVKADFTARGEGVLIGYIVGHEHWDWQGVSERYPRQQIHSFQSSANDGWQNYCSDLPRLEGTKAEDCITVLSVDHKNRVLYMVRVGSNITNMLVDRTYISFAY